MSEEKKVYVVYRGDYDQEIDRIYSTKEKADAFMNGCEKVESEFSCEEHRVDQYEDDHLVRYYRVQLYFDTGKFRSADGETTKVWENAIPLSKGEPPSDVCVTDIPRGLSSSLGIEVRSPVSADHAMKLAVEQRQLWLRSQISREPLL